MNNSELLYIYFKTDSELLTFAPDISETQKYNLSRRAHVKAGYSLGKTHAEIVEDMRRELETLNDFFGLAVEQDATKSEE